MKLMSYRIRFVESESSLVSTTTYFHSFADADNHLAEAAKSVPVGPYVHRVWFTVDVDAPVTGQHKESKVSARAIYDGCLPMAHPAMVGRDPFLMRHILTTCEEAAVHPLASIFVKRSANMWSNLLIDISQNEQKLFALAEHAMQAHLAFARGANMAVA